MTMQACTLEWNTLDCDTLDPEVQSTLRAYGNVRIAR